jgi:hypothetical protein
MKKLSARTRAQLISDSFSLCQAGYIKIDVPLNLIGYMSEEVDFLPWKVLIDNHITFFIDILSSSEFSGELKSYLAALVKPYYDKVGWNEVSVNSDRSFQKSIIEFACKVDEAGCVETSKSYFIDWMSNPNLNNIPDALQATVYCTAVRHGGRAEFDFLFKKITSYQSSHDQDSMLSGLACTNEHWQLVRLLNSRLVRGDDGLLNVVGGSSSHLIAWDFIKNNWSLLFKR